MSDLLRVGQLVEQFGKDLQTIATPIPPPPSPAPLPVPPPVIVTTAKQPLTGDRLVWDRTIRLPATVDGLRNACGGFGVRVVDGRRQGIFLGNKNQGDAFIVDLDTGDEATFISTITDYHHGGVNMNVGDPIGDAAVTPTGATYDPVVDHLLWTFHDPYNTTQRDDFSWGFTRMLTGVAYGPYKALPSSHRTSGYPVIMPGGRLCFGAPLTSGNIGSSFGPCLYEQDGTALLDYDVTRRCRRNADYIINAGDPNEPDIAPDAGGGYWTQADFFNGMCPVDLPDVSGLVALGYLAHGHIWYGGTDFAGAHDAQVIQGPHAEFRIPTMLIYNLDKPDPLQFEELAMPGLATGQLPVLSGSWCDVEKRELFVCAPNADYSRGLNGSLGLLHVWKIK